MNRSRIGAACRRIGGLLLPALMVAGLGTPVLAAPQKPFRPAAPADVPAVATRDVPKVSAKRDDAIARAAAKTRPAPVWPKAGTAEVTLPSGLALSRGDDGPVRAAGLPVSVRARSGAPARVRVQTFDRATAKAAGFDGALLRVGSVATAAGTASATAAGRGSVEVTVDYSGFAGAYGGSWASRLRLVAVPDCALSTPQAAACAATPLASTNDATRQTVTATVPVGAMLATESDTTGAAGDYSATSLQASSTWSAGSNTGDFTWSYPMRVPPAVGGPVPDVTLAYSSASVDGRMAASNNQPGWAGAGFELAPGGFIERRYKPCADDMGKDTNEADPNNTVKTGDMCWATDNATLSLSGHSGELIYNASEGRWHLRGDDGSRVQRRTGTVNGDDDGEYWVVTTTDGTQYWFGRNRLPGWSANKPETASTLTEPVFGNHPLEPCHATGFAGSACTQAYRWNLDWVIDMNGNTMSLWYETASNKYAKNQATTSPVSYLRDGWLKKIEYGTRSSNDLVLDPMQTTSADSIFTSSAPMRVEFTTDDRCLSGCTTHDDVHWPDMPWDLECAGSPCYISSPSFWSTKRLKQVKTYVWDAAATPAATYRPVETWTLTHSFPDSGQGNQAGMWLARLSHAGGAATVPDIEFDGVLKDNRVDPVAIPDGLPSMSWWRVSQIKTETGATISVDYSDEDCVKGVKMPSTTTLQDNHYRCFPVRWTPQGYQNPILEFFHKYVVEVVREDDNTGGTQPFGSPEVVHSYSYPVDGAAWHYSDEDGLIKKEDKTWSGWRGYASVGVTTGDPGSTDTRAYTVSEYFRGMNGDYLTPTTTRSVSLPAVDMNGDSDVVDAVDAPAVTDEDAFAGQLRRTVTYLGVAGGEIASQVHQPWQSAATASRTLNDVTVSARYTGVQSTRSRVALDHAPWWRTTSTRTQFDTYGMPVKQDDFGDDADSDDNRCTVTTYLRNGTPWLMGTVKEILQVALDCDTATNAQTTIVKADVIADVQTSFDGLSWGTQPLKGMPTQVGTALDWTPGNPGSPADQVITKAVYDSHGRVIEAYDGLDRKSTTTFTPLTGGPVTQTVSTSPAPFYFTATTEIDPAFGLPKATIDTNGRRTDATYNGLGWITAVWLPGRDRLDPANVTYSYLIRDDGPIAVTTNRINPENAYVATYQLMDGLFRTRQTQGPSPSGGRVVSDTFYDSLGQVKLTFAAYHDSRGGPGTTLVVPQDRHDVPQQMQIHYDGAGRATDTILDPFNNGERWRTHSDYRGDRVDTTPPSGGTATSTFTDVLGRTTQLWQYTADETPTGAHTTTTYGYDRRGNLASVLDTASNLWSYGFDMLGRRLTTNDPDAGQSSTEYDKAGQVKSSTNALGQKLVRTYDNIGRQVGLYLTDTSTANKRVTWTYDTAYFDDGVTLAKGQPATSVRWTNNGTRSYTTATQRYNDLYQPTKSTVTVPSAETGLNGTYTFESTFRPDGSPESTTYPGVGGLADEAVTVGYEPTLGLPYGLDTILGVDEFSLVSDTQYDALARPSQHTLYTGRYSATGSRVWLSYEREPETGRLSHLRASREAVAPNSLSDITYTYDDAGNVTKAADSVSGDNQCFDHDQLQRLVEAWTPAAGVCSTQPTTAGLGGPAPYWTTWTINTVGNRTQQVEHKITAGGVDQTTGYQYPLAGSARPHGVTGTTGSTTGTFGYDAAGNTTCRPLATNNSCTGAATGSQGMTWDAEGHLASSTDSSGTTTYIYSAGGERLIRIDPTGKTLYLPGQELRYTTTTATKASTRYYVFGGQTVASRTAAGLTWLAADRQGTAQVAVNAVTQQATVRRQTPYGGVRGAAVTWPDSKGFVGGVRDNTGLVHLGAREYDPVTGRFLSADPVVELTDPQQMNGYAYAKNSPVTMSDPTGLLEQGDHVYNEQPQLSVSTVDGKRGVLFHRIISPQFLLRTQHVGVLDDGYVHYFECGPEGCEDRGKLGKATRCQSQAQIPPCYIGEGNLSYDEEGHAADCNRAAGPCSVTPLMTPRDEGKCENKPLAPWDPKSRKTPNFIPTAPNPIKVLTSDDMLAESDATGGMIGFCIGGSMSVLGLLGGEACLQFGSVNWGLVVTNKVGGGAIGLDGGVGITLSNAKYVQQLGGNDAYGEIGGGLGPVATIGYANNMPDEGKQAIHTLSAQLGVGGKISAGGGIAGSTVFDFGYPW